MTFPFKITQDLIDAYQEHIAKLSPKEYYDFCQERSKARGLPAWTTWEEYYELLETTE